MESRRSLFSQWLPGLRIQETPADDDLRSGAPPAYVLDGRRLRAAFLDLFGRPPFLAERAEWEGRGLPELLDAKLGDPALWQNWLDEQLYYFFLIENFRPSAKRVLNLPSEMAAGRTGIREALHRIALCASFDRRNPGPDTFVTVVMEQLLGVTVQKSPRELEVGKRMYDGGKTKFLDRLGSNQADVVRIVIEDRRSMRHFVTREAQRLLRTEPTRRDIGAWAKRLEKDDRVYPEILRGWLLSEAYEERMREPKPQPNRIFVRSLFVDLVDRLPAVEEADRMRNALDGLADAGPLRSVLARLIVDSGEAKLPLKSQIDDPTQWVAGLFERLLGRPAAEEELKAFVGAFHEPACQPSTVLYAIVSHPEYQTW